MSAGTPPVLGVAIAAFNAAEVLGRCLDSLVPHASRLEIVVVDNASRDATAEIASGHASGATLLEMGTNLGFGAAVNRGVGALSTPEALILNPDAAVTEIDFDAIAALGSRPVHGLLAIGDALGEAGPYREPGVLRDAFEQIVQRPQLRRAPGSADGERPSGAVWISGWGALVRRSEFVELGGFDERYFVYYEDRDLSRRYRRAGLPLGSTRAVVAFHEQGTGASHAEVPSGLRTAYSLLSFAEYRSSGGLGLPAPLIVVLMVATMLVARLLLRIAGRLTPGGGRLERRALAIESTLGALDRLAGDLGAARRGYPQAQRALPAACRLIPRSLAEAARP